MLTRSRALRTLACALLLASAHARKHHERTNDTVSTTPSRARNSHERGPPESHGANDTVSCHGQPKSGTTWLEVIARGRVPCLEAPERSSRFDPS